MKGYRKLKVGEVIREGDGFMNPLGTFTTYKTSIGTKNANKTTAYRPITKKPVEYVNNHDRLVSENEKLSESEKREQWYDRLVQTKVSGKYPSLKAYVESLQSENDRLREALKNVSKDISDFALNIKTKESTYNDGYCDGMLKATKFIEQALERKQP